MGLPSKLSTLHRTRAAQLPKSLVQHSPTPPAKPAPEPDSFMGCSLNSFPPPLWLWVRRKRTLRSSVRTGQFPKTLFLNENRYK